LPWTAVCVAFVGVRSVRRQLPVNACMHERSNLVE
jgi:hypothetical protein